MYRFEGTIHKYFKHPAHKFQTHNNNKIVCHLKKKELKLPTLTQLDLVPRYSGVEKAYSVSRIVIVGSAGNCK